MDRATIVNRAIAEKVHGWKDGGNYWIKEPKSDYRLIISSGDYGDVAILKSDFDPYNRVEQAIEARNKMIERGWHFSLYADKFNVRCILHKSLNPHRDWDEEEIITTKGGMAGPKQDAAAISEALYAAIGGER